MKKNVVTVTVTGPSGSGKSTAILAACKALREAGFECDLPEPLSRLDTKDFIQHERALQSVPPRSKIIFVEVQPRNVVSTESL